MFVKHYWAISRMLTIGMSFRNVEFVQDEENGRL